MLLGFAGAFRRSELVGLDVADLAFSRAGLVVPLRRSKTDQQGVVARRGPRTAATQRPARCARWGMARRELPQGRVTLFCPINRHEHIQQSRLSDKVVALVVKRAPAAAGLDPTTYAGHSLRAGLATVAAMAGAGERVIMAQTGHQSERMVRKYICERQLFRENATALVGL